MSIIFYNSHDIFIKHANREKLKEIPGGEMFSLYFKVFSQNITAVDRTNTITTPLDVSVLPHLQMPQFESFTSTFEEICDNRAQELMFHAKKTGRKLAVMYSGGIDSTLILCALLKNCTEEDLKSTVVVLLSNASIRENPNFFYNHVIKKFNCVSSFRYTHFLGNDNYVFVSGENGDQLFGSQVVSAFTQDRPFADVFKNINNMEGELINWMYKTTFKFNEPQYTKQHIEQLFFIFKKIVDAAPVKLDTVYKFFWWINFTTKWHSVYVRPLPFSKNLNTIKFEENYTTFYCTKEFQLWAMNNHDSFIKDTPDTAKYVSKDYIFKYNKDLEYLKKPKIGSLWRMFRQKNIPFTLDQNLKANYNYPDNTMYNYSNDFMEIK